MLTNEGAIAFMLLLQMIMKGRRIAMRMGRSGLGLETTQVTHEMPRLIPPVSHKLLLLCFGGHNHVRCGDRGAATVQFLRA